MGRRNRRSILFDGCYAHVFSRAIEKKCVCESEADFKRFKEILYDSKRNYTYRIHHYCLMHTHFHLVVSMDSVKRFSEGLKWVKWNYSRYFNYHHKRFGPLWRDRFKSLVIENEGYLQACGRYVEGNPVEAGLVARCEDWPHSSSRRYFSGENDILVDDYTFGGENIVIAGEPEECFTKGSVIGSELFKIHCHEELVGSMPVPR